MLKTLIAAMFFTLSFAVLAQETAPAPAPAAPAPAAPAPAAPAAPAPAPAPAAPASKEPSLMETIGKGGKGPEDTPAPAGEVLNDEQKAAQVKLQAAEKDTRRPKEVPAKYWDAEKGEVLHAAWAKSTTELETRMRTVGLPPKEAVEYKFDVPKVLKDSGFDLDPAMAKGFRDRAFALGLTQKQYEGVMGDYLQQIPALADQVSQFSQEKCRSSLMAHYKSEEAMTEAVRDGYQAVFSLLPNDLAQRVMDMAGNIPEVTIAFARVAKEMKEDPGVRPDAILDGESLETLMRGSPGKEDSPYWNADDPRHKSVKAKVMAHHEAKAKVAQRKAA